MALSLKGTQTEKNILIAFAGESQARNRYSFFASKAKDEGFQAIGKIFLETAEQEREHASRLFKFLEGGNLDYKITVSGKNELSSLAKGLDDMRIAFKEKNDNEIQMLKANKRIITEMSHDLRTPLTSVMLYSDILSGLERVGDHATNIAFSILGNSKNV